MAAPLIGARLREKRLSLGLRQAELAEKAGISASYLNLIEHNRRNVTPEVLTRLSTVLGVELAPLSEGANAALAEDLRRAGATSPKSGPEVERLEDFMARYPGWARLIAELYARNESLERAVDLLNDRLGHDPRLSAALHELLSALSGVRATAEILAETEDLSAEWQRKFHHNLHQDSERLATGTSRLITFLDRPQELEPLALMSPQEEMEHWLSARNWSLPEAEEGNLAPLEAEIAQIASVAGRQMAHAFLTQMINDIKALPLTAFRTALAENRDPALLAARFGASVLAAMRRIAFLPESRAGLVVCDGAGAMLFRKPAEGFSLPRFGAACALWPLYSVLARPGLALAQRVAIGSQKFLTLSACEGRAPFGFSGPDLRRAAMLILPDEGETAPLSVGSSCRICAKEACPARSEPSLLGKITSPFDRSF